MTDYTKEAEELYRPSNKSSVYETLIKRQAHIAARQQSAAEIDRLRGEVERLTMDNMTHEFNQAEAEKFAPEYERQIREDEANKWRGEVERLKGLLHETWNKQYPHPQYVQDLWQQFKTENNIQ